MWLNEEMPAFWALVVVVAGVPLALVPGLYFFDITPKLLLLVVGACVLWVLLSRSGQARPADARLSWLLAAQAVAATAATLFSIHPMLSLVGSDWRRLGLPATLACLAVAAAVVPLTAGEPQRQRTLLAFLAVCGALAALYSLAQYWGLDPWSDPDLYTIGAGEWAIVRPPSTLGYVSYLATYLLYVMFAAAGLGLTARRASETALWALVTLTAALALLVSGSRGAWLGAVLGAAVLVSGIKPRRLLLLAFWAFTALAGAFVLSPYGQLLRSRVRWFVEDPGGGSRLWLWRDSLRLAAGQRPALVWLVLGRGPETFERSFPPFQSAELARRFPDRYFESPHNVVLDHLTTTGGAGALAFLLLALAALRNYYRAEGRLARSLLAATAAALVSQQFIADTIPTRLYFLVFAALSFTFTGPGQAARPPQFRAAVLLSGVACLAFSLFYGARLLRADRAMARARTAATAGDLDTLVTEGNAARRLFPWGGTYDLAFSRLVASPVMKPWLAPSSRGLLLALAEDGARAALHSAASPQLVGVHLASLYVVGGKWAEAESALAAAARAAPQWYRPHWLLAELLHQQGRRQQAAAEARLALETGARQHPEVAQRCLLIERLSSP